MIAWVVQAPIRRWTSKSKSMCVFFMVFCLLTCCISWPLVPPVVLPSSIVSRLGAAFFFSAAMIIFINILSTVVTEKELKLRHSLQMMGLRTSVYWISHFLTYAGLNFLSSLTTCTFGIVFGFTFFSNSSFFVCPIAYLSSLWHGLIILI